MVLEMTESEAQISLWFDSKIFLIAVVIFNPLLLVIGEVYNS